MSSAIAAPPVVSAMAWHERSPFRGACYRCHAKDVLLHAITQQCHPCHDGEMAEFDARMKEDREYFAGWERDRLDHITSCAHCAKTSDTYGRIPPSYRCPRLAGAVLAMAAADPR